MYHVETVEASASANLATLDRDHTVWKLAATFYDEDEKAANRLALNLREQVLLRVVRVRKTSASIEGGQHSRTTLIMQRVAWPEKKQRRRRRAAAVAA